MSIKIGDGLLLLNLLVVLLIITIMLISSDILRIILGIPFLLLFPGYTLAAALFPRKEGVKGFERVALSVGLSIAVVPLIVLILNYTPWGIKLDPVLYSVASFILITSIIAWLRRTRLPKEECLSIEFWLRMPGWGGSAWDKALAVILALAIMGGLGTLGYVIATPRTEEMFTSFYIFGLDGKAADYPLEMVAGEEGKVMLGIMNHEYQAMSYRVEVRIDEVKNNEVGPIMLEHGEKWEEEVSFMLKVAGENHRVEFLLYENGETKSSLEPLQLWVDVRM